MMKTKRIFTGVAAAALVLTLGAVSFSAAETVKGRFFTDPDGDGICDFSGRGCTFADEDGDGICDFYNEQIGSGANQGQNFADDNNDGICDNYSQNRCGGFGRGCGNGGYGRRGRCGR